MHDAWQLYRDRGPAALWQRTLGFFDYDLEQTMAVQRRGLEEQLPLLNASLLGQWLFRGAAPRTMEEFRERVPLTSYDDYQDTLGQRREDVLPAPALAWTRTSGRTHNQPKWAPCSAALIAESEWLWTGVMLAACADEPGQVALPGGLRLLNMTAPPPYASGTILPIVARQWPVRFFPPDTPETDALPSEVRMGAAFRAAVANGLDMVVSLSSVLASIGETFQDRRPPGSIVSRLRQPRAFARMGRAALRARIAGRRIYPRDAWRVRGLISGGMDSSLFRGRIHEYWGRYPLDVLVSTEGELVGMQNWDRTTLTLVPALNFYEFVPDDELLAERQQPGYRPRTVLQDQLEAGRNYELVLTNLLGGAFVRYRTGDILRVTGLSNPITGTALPQWMHFARRTELLEVGGFVTLTEQTVWRAIEDAGVPYEDWSVRKEVDGTDPILHLRIEPKAGSMMPAEEARERIHRQLGLLEPDWRDMESIAGISPLRVTYLPVGSFQHYRDRKVAEGADLGHLKPQHMNATDEVIAILVEAGKAATPVK